MRNTWIHGGYYGKPEGTSLMKMSVWRARGGAVLEIIEGYELVDGCYF